MRHGLGGPGWVSGIWPEEKDEDAGWGDLWWPILVAPLLVELGIDLAGPPSSVGGATTPDGRKGEGGGCEGLPLVGPSEDQAH
jgi:hypothetical protein